MLIHIIVPDAEFYPISISSDTNYEQTDGFAGNDNVDLKKE